MLTLEGTGECRLILRQRTLIGTAILFANKKWSLRTVGRYIAPKELEEIAEKLRKLDSYPRSLT